MFTPELQWQSRGKWRILQGSTVIGNPSYRRVRRCKIHGVYIWSSLQGGVCVSFAPGFAAHGAAQWIGTVERSGAAEPAGCVHSSMLLLSLARDSLIKARARRPAQVVRRIPTVGQVGRWAVQRTPVYTPVSYAVSPLGCYRDSGVNIRY